MCLEVWHHDHSIGTNFDLQAEKFATPFPEEKLPDVTDEMRRQNYTITDIYKMAERFFTSMGLQAMPEYV